MDANFKQIYTFLGLTLLFGLLVWIFSYRLALVPKVFIHSETLVRPGWQALSIEKRPFTLNVPISWEQHNGFDEEMVGLNTAVSRTNQLFTNSDDTIQLQLVAYDTPQYALAIFSSDRLHRLESLPQFVQVVQESDPLYQTVDLYERTWLPTQVRFVGIEIEGSPQIQCEMRLAPAEEQAFILILCVERSAYTLFRDEITEIFDSFQPLE